jgi:hypothetical protein
MGLNFPGCCKLMEHHSTRNKIVALLSGYATSFKSSKRMSILTPLCPCRATFLSTSPVPPTSYLTSSHHIFHSIVENVSALVVNCRKCLETSLYLAALGYPLMGLGLRTHQVPQTGLGSTTSTFKLVPLHGCGPAWTALIS